MNVRLTALLVMLLAATPSHAANPFLGRWAMESFGQTGELVFEFLDETRMLVASAGSASPEQAYTLDLGREVITLPMSEGGDIVLHYVWLDRDTFVLFMSEGLLDQMSDVFTASLPRGTNDLTDEIVEKLRVAVRQVFAESPFMRGTRVGRT